MTFPDGRILRTTKTRHPRGFMQGRYLESQRDVEAADKPFEFFMNRFRLLEAAPRVEFSQYTGLSEEVIRPQLEEAIAQGYLTECADYWQITEHGKLFLNSLLELFWRSKFVLPDAACVYAASGNNSCVIAKIT